MCARLASPRFRRLHDLKRHTQNFTQVKDLTYVRKCGRRFARGDALARPPTKAKGGCAGRRSQHGQLWWWVNDDYPEGNKGRTARAWMGFLYTQRTRTHGIDEGRRESKEDRVCRASREHVAPSDSEGATKDLQPSNAYQARQPRTYPPIGGRDAPPGGSLFPQPQAMEVRAHSPLSGILQPGR